MNDNDLGSGNKSYYDQLHRDLCDDALAMRNHLIMQSFEASTNRMMLKSTMDYLFASRLMTQCMPRENGGLGAKWKTLTETSRIISRYCPSSGWLVSLAGSHTLIAARFPASLRKSIFEDSNNPLIATSSFSTGHQIKKVDNGLVVDGVWHFSSGIDYATHVLLTGTYAGEQVFLNVKPDQVITKDSWDVIGLSATGSKDLELRGCFIYEKAVFDKWSLIEGSGKEVGTLNGANIGPMLSSSVIGPVLGCAEGAFEEFLDQAKGLKSKYFDWHHIAIGEASTKIDLARKTYNNIVERLDSVESGIALSKHDAVRIRRDCAYLAMLCYQVVQNILKIVGIRSIFRKNRLQLYWSDIQVMTTHIDVEWSAAMIEAGASELKQNSGSIADD